MKYHVRIPFGVKYGYLEVEIENANTFDTDGNPIPIDWTSIMFDAVSAEVAYREAYELPKIGESNSVMVEEAVNQGATLVGATPPVESPQRPQQPAPAPLQRPQQQQVVQNYTDHSQQYTCKNCGGPAARGAKAIETRYGMSYPINCTNGCVQERNGRTFPFTSGWEKA